MPVKQKFKEAFKEAGHKLESRSRKIIETYCVQEGCEFKDQHAAQGICHSRNSRATTNYIDKIMANGEEMLKEMKALRIKNGARSQATWIKHLEGQIVCLWANDTSLLDLLVHLRAENARLRLKLGIYKKGAR